MENMTIGNIIWMVVCFAIAFIMVEMPFWQEEQDEKREKEYKKFREFLKSLKKEEEDA